MIAAAKDPKTELQEWLQARRWQLPMYRVVGTTGAAHQQTFDVECEVPELKQSQRGIGSSRRSGEQAAALAMLKSMVARKPPHDLPRTSASWLNAVARWPSLASPMWASPPCSMRLVGQKISITSRKAQTTRHRITGIRTTAQTQFIFVDTPGFQTAHGNALNRSLNKTVLGAVGDVDLVLFVVNAGSFAAADAKVMALLSNNIPAMLVANKLDKVNRREELGPLVARDAKQTRVCRVCADVSEKPQRHRTFVGAVPKIPARASLVVCRG